MGFTARHYEGDRLVGGPAREGGWVKVWPAPTTDLWGNRALTQLQIFLARAQRAHGIISFFGAWRGHQIAKNIAFSGTGDGHLRTAPRLKC